MADKKSFIIYDNWAKLLYDMPVEQAGKLIKAICGYKLGECESTGDAVLDAVFGMIKEQLDKDDAKYAEICVKRSNAGKSKKQQTNDIKAEQVHTDTDNDNDNDNEVSKDTKHIYGTYKHVRLTDEEYQKLRKEYGDTETGKAITYLDEYIEMKGYKAKSHYLCIRKWVFDAVKRSNQQAGNTPKKHFGTERTDIDYAELLRSRVVN